MRICRATVNGPTIPDRIIYYSSFTDRGLTINDRGLDSLVRFMTARSQLFTPIYFHRTVRAIDLTLIDLFGRRKVVSFSRKSARAPR